MANLAEMLAAKKAAKAALAAQAIETTQPTTTPIEATVPPTVADIAAAQPEATLAEVETMVADALPAEDRIETPAEELQRGETTEDAFIENEPVAVIGDNGADEVITYPELRVAVMDLWDPKFDNFKGKKLVLPSQNDFAKNGAVTASSEAKKRKIDGGKGLNGRRNFYDKAVATIKAMAVSHGYIIDGVETASEVAAAPAATFSAPVVAPAVPAAITAPVETTNPVAPIVAPVAPETPQAADNAVETSGVETTIDAAPVVAAEPAVVEPVGTTITEHAAEPASGAPVFVAPTQAKVGDKIDLDAIARGNDRKQHAQKQKNKQQAPIKDLAELAPKVEKTAAAVADKKNGGFPPHSFVSKHGETFFAVWDRRPTYSRELGLPEYCLLQVLNAEGRSQQIGFHPEDIRRAELENFTLMSSAGDLKIPMVMEAYGFHKPLALGHNIDFTKAIKWHAAIWMPREAADAIMMMQELTSTNEFKLVAVKANSVCLIRVV